MQRYSCLFMLCLRCNYPSIEVTNEKDTTPERPVVSVDKVPSIDHQVEVNQIHNEPPVPSHEWNDNARIWLARSVIGEVGWNRPAEQAAVAWVYANRAKKLKNYTFTRMVRRYSAAIRQPGRTRQPWVFELQLNDHKPRQWPSFVDWNNKHSKYWLDTLELIDEWQAGRIPNYCPSANHFGNYGDSLRAEALRWTRIKCIVPEGDKQFRNRFYDSTKLRPRRKKLRQV